MGERQRVVVVPVVFPAEHVVHPLPWRVLGNLGLLEETVEDAVLQCLGPLQEAGEVAEHEHPLLKHRHRLQLLLSPLELGKLQIDKGELVVEHVVVQHVFQLHDVAVAVGGVLAFGECEVEHSHGIHLFQAVVPVLTFGGLLPYGVGGVEERAVSEVLLFALLHLNDETPAIISEAIDIEDGPPVAVAVAEVLAVQVLHISYLLLLVAKERVEETDEQVLVHRRAEQLLEPEVGAGIDVSLLARDGLCYGVIILLVAHRIQFLF